MQTYPTEPASLQAIREFVRSGARAARLEAGITGDAVLAASEASANAILHSGGSYVQVEFEVDLPCIRIRVRDDGVFDRHVPAPELEGNDGRGLRIIVALMDEVNLQEGSLDRPGTCVTMTRCVT